MRTITLTNGAALTLDGDLLTILETLYREMTAKRELEHTFEDTMREIQHVIDQMNDDERRHYLSESLFLSFVSYENGRLGALIKSLPPLPPAARTSHKAEPASRGRAK